MKKNIKLFQFVKTYVIIITGTLMMALSLNIFLIPQRIVTGGASGIGTILYHLTGIKVGVWMLVINIPLFAVGIRSMGVPAMVRTGVATVLLSVFTDATSGVWFADFDHVISSVYGGALMGLGLGVVFLTSSATGGSDLAAKQLEVKLKTISPGRLLLIIDAVIIVSSAFVFRDYSAALYGFLSLYISGAVIDIITGGVGFAKAVFVISDSYDRIKSAVTEDMQRGVTVFYAGGGYTDTYRPVLFCVITKREVVCLKKIVRSLDPGAFVIVTDAREVLGEGF